MTIGFYTSTFNDRPLEEVVDFAASAGFDAIEIDVGGHIKAPDRVEDAVSLARSLGLFVSSITYFGNQLDADRERRRELRAGTLEFASAIGQAGVPIFVIFPGRDDTASDEANYDDFADFANGLIAETQASGLTFAIENWPGPGDNFIGTTPKGWQELFRRVEDRRFGLEFDPSHLIRIGVDPYRALEAVKDRIAILHAKDTAIDKEALQALGYHGKGWWHYKLPGLGLLDWPRFLRQARGHGFAGTLSIEHEDASYGWPGKDLAARRQGARLGLDYLKSVLNGL
ncbi:sugar phosphate isomerase/epimerase family protein [Rhizobium bangladeshense]|uniref:sugar phosphate isomerase/epimerase family protein n=1 Tax=Rhizobium bangladeshense TaxID=1138189 RepID=UPI001C830329|nr:sugar phosphate isomerase/epimerase [Rhizobium bangladeshense]MBX4896897.1 sugar phosphate isomerase/epimerase [Rhizobium bangladeshense]MBX4901063.1 sugar phosphate isomerase/epimerase [Rhizobium bangladeshense]MBX4915772.1 sugar phosphate isomerase/epimerase [Rhizobium bangladeshense]MBX4920633.1 sugar phosphate isomerase/epimerase [Rhizobium bangladeshense]MBY3614071.1 sugar phosphate isomerase/epimerase [Rhizobium bangladeshense]